MGKLDELMKGGTDRVTVSASVEKTTADNLEKVSYAVGCNRSELMRAMIDEGLVSVMAKIGGPDGLIARFTERQKAEAAAAAEAAKKAATTKK